MLCEKRELTLLTYILSFSQNKFFNVRVKFILSSANAFNLEKVNILGFNTPTKKRLSLKSDGENPQG